MTHFAIDQIETAINLMRRLEGTEGQKLGPKTRHLADLYGNMIYYKQVSISATELTTDQLLYLGEAGFNITIAGGQQ